MALLDDLEAEQDRLAGILAGLDEAQWATPSGAAGWTVADVVLHLAHGAADPAQPVPWVEVPMKPVPWPCG